MTNKEGLKMKKTLSVGTSKERLILTVNMPLEIAEDFSRRMREEPGLAWHDVSHTTANSNNGNRRKFYVEINVSRVKEFKAFCKRYAKEKNLSFKKLDQGNS